MKNILQGMPEEVILKTIKQKYSSTKSPSRTRLKLNNGTEHIGWCQHVEGWTELEAKNHFTFLPVNNALKFQEHVNKHQKGDPSLVIEIAAKDVAEIELIFN